MEEQGKTILRIVVKKKKGHGGHHGGAWKVAYADFITAMMALFIVLWIVGQNKPVKQSISEYFKDPGVFSEKTKSGGIFSGSSEPQIIEKKVAPIKGAEEPISEMERLKTEGSKIEGLISKVPAFQKFKDRIEITASEKGLRIDLIDNSSGLFFDVGSARIKPETVELLKLIAGEIGRLHNSVIIEGYTDARPFFSEGYSNWELSVDRANRARKILMENGLREDQVLEVRGFADRKLRNHNDPYDFSNRRVSILVTPKS